MFYKTKKKKKSIQDEYVGYNTQDHSMVSYFLMRLLSQKYLFMHTQVSHWLTNYIKVIKLVINNYSTLIEITAYTLIHFYIDSVKQQRIL